VLPRASARAWQLELARRLRLLGETVRLAPDDGVDAWPGILRAVLAAEQRLSRGSDGLWEQVGYSAENREGAAGLVLDLSARDAPRPGALALRFDGSSSASAAASALLRGNLP